MDENNTFSQYETPLKDMVDYAERLELTEDRYEKSTGGQAAGSARPQFAKAEQARRRAVAQQAMAFPNRVTLREVSPLNFQRIVTV